MQASQPFRRAKAMFTAIAAAMGLSGIEKELALNAIGPYESQGKGRAKLPSPRFITARGKRYPRSSTRQHQRHAASQHTVVVNGFELMQTLPSRLRTKPN